jgi:hypothetical protein
VITFGSSVVFSCCSEEGNKPEDRMDADLSSIVLQIPSGATDESLGPNTSEISFDIMW